jgi:hypothetical protein
MTPETTPPVMVFAMHVIGDGAAERHKLGARCDRQEITIWANMGDDLIQKHATLSRQQSLIAIEVQYLFLRLHGHKEARIIMAAIAVGATISERQQARIAGQGSREISFQPLQRKVLPFSPVNATKTVEVSFHQRIPATRSSTAPSAMTT